MDLSGIFAALTTPFAADESLLLTDLKLNIEKYNRTGLAGYVVAGSTGEAVMLSREEFSGVLAAVKMTAAPGKLLLAGTGAESTRETIERTKAAADIGYDAALVKTPFYYKSGYKPAVLVAHYRRVADQAQIPVLLYSIPQFTGIALEPAEVRALSEHPNIIGIKDSSGNVQRVSETIAGTPRDFQTLVGSASTLYASLAVGARGGILALASVLPEKCVELYRFFADGRHEAAAELQKRLLRASQAIVSEFPISGVKYAMDLRGYRGGRARSPLAELKEEHKKAVEEVLRSVTTEETAALDLGVRN